MVDTNTEYTEIVDGEEFVEVTGTGGSDFPPVHDWNASPELIGTYLGTKTVQAKGKDRTLHTFDVDGEEVTSWGAAILDSRLGDLEAQAPIRVKVVSTGAKIPTKSGHGAKEFKVFAARSALA